jgi:hypothetical protein
MYAAKRFSCGPGAERRDPTKQFYIKLLFYNTVKLGRCHALPAVNQQFIAPSRFFSVNLPPPLGLLPL